MRSTTHASTRSPAACAAASAARRRCAGRGPAAKLLHALRHGRVIGLLIDQDIDAPGAFVEFFGRPAWTPTGAALLALRSRCPVVTGFAVRRGDGTMRLEFDPPVAPPAGDDLEADVARLTAALTARIERQVRAHPEQWVWMHRRWRHQPGDGETVWRDASRRPVAGATRPPAAWAKMAHRVREQG